MKAFSFESSAGLKLSGWLHEPTGEPRGAVVLAHCFTCTKDLLLPRTLGKRLAGAGFAVLRFDFAGIGQSEGDLAQSTLAADAADLGLAVATLRRRLGEDLPVSLVGHSLGGSAALLAAHGDPSVRAVAVIASPLRPSRLTRMLGSEIETRARQQGATDVRIGGRKFVISRQFLQSLESEKTADIIGKLGRPFLVIQGTEDLQIRRDDSSRMVALARSPRVLWEVEGGDHLLSRPRHAAEAAEVLALWLGQVVVDAPRGD